MKIVVLDGYTLNPGDLSWEPLSNIGTVEIYDRTPADKVIMRAKGAEMLLTNKTVLSEDQLRSLPELKYVGVLATGFNVIDAPAARKLGITVTNIPAYSTDSVAQLVFALILEFCFHVQKHSDSVLQGNWCRSIDFSYREWPLIELASKTIGILGFGTIGKKTADIAASFGMNILACSRTKSDQSRRKNFRWADTAEEIFRESDFLSIHTPLTSDTKGLVNTARLSLMKKTAFLINTSRGPVINEKDLADALNSGMIAGAGLDVLSSEPPSEDNPLLKARNCIITPHIAWATFEARSRLMDVAVENVRAYMSGTPVNVVN